MKKFDRDLGVLLTRLNKNADKETRKKLNTLKDRLIRLNEENVVKINHSVIKVLITDYCAYCSTIISICSLFTLASEGKLQTIIIDIMTYPEIGEQYDVTTVPTLVINEDNIIVGDITAEELLYEIINKTL